MLLSLLFKSEIDSLTFSHWLWVIFLSDKQWVLPIPECLFLRNNLTIWLDGSDWVLSWSLLLSFWRWRWIGISLAIASIPKEGEI